MPFVQKAFDIFF